jgi:selenocysteine lyase/cysteine desulfurase
MVESGRQLNASHVNTLNERLIAGVDELGGAVVTPPEPERRARLRPLDRTRRRSWRRSPRTASSRRRAPRTRAFSSHAYNAEEDIDAVLAALARVGPKYSIREATHLGLDARSEHPREDGAPQIVRDQQLARAP